MPRILIADDHAVVRQGLCSIIAEEWPQANCGQAASATELMRLAHAEFWDAVVLDLHMPGTNGLDALKDLKQAQPHLPVLVLTMHPAEQYAVRVMRAGASGYLNKESATEELSVALHKILSGGRYINAAVAELLASAIGEAHTAAPHQALSDREFQVLRAIASGKTVSEIAEELSLSVATVSTYRARILEKMGLRTNAELTTYAIRNDLV
jgi:DNA-binding NarL/FixJ family response regulator